MNDYHDYEKQPRPFMYFPEKMPKQHHESTFASISSRHQQPVDQAGYRKHHQKDERNNIYDPELFCFIG
jgi:hypothetical protein